MRLTEAHKPLADIAFRQFHKVVTAAIIGPVWVICPLAEHELNCRNLIQRKLWEHAPSRFSTAAVYKSEPTTPADTDYMPWKGKASICVGVQSHRWVQAQQSLQANIVKSPSTCLDNKRNQ